MSFRVRPGRLEDVSSIVPWTTDTFSWGDYVPDRLPQWLDDPDSEFLVCVDEADVPQAVVNATMLSPLEGWLEAARVHPDHRRSGMGTALNQAGVAWARERGAQVVRLATEADNAAAVSQVVTLGYRQTSSWLYARWSSDEVQRGGSASQLRPAAGSDVDASWVFWSTSDLAQAGHGLMAQGWHWSKARPETIQAAARTGNLYQSPAGWVIVDKPGGSGAHVRAFWIATAKGEAPSLIEGLLDLAAERESELAAMVPNVAWASEAFTRAGASISEVLVFSLAL